MIRYWLAAASALTLTAGVAVAQMSLSTTTSTPSSPVAPAQLFSLTTDPITRRAIDLAGVAIDGTQIFSGDSTVTHAPRITPAQQTR